MRHLLQYIFLALAFVVVSGHAASADPRTDARAHYQAGVKFYSSGDYSSAIKEFTAAQQLVPADLNNYNLALCYDKLGQADQAVQFYRAFLDKQPNTDKRAEIEASIARLDAASKSATAKKAEEARKADEAKKAEEARKAEDARKADEARKAEEAKKQPDPNAPVAGPPAPPAPAPPAPTGPAVGAGSTGTPATGAAVSTGDAQLDRVQAIDVNAVRDQRAGVMPPDTRTPPPPGGNAQVTTGAPPPQGGVAQAAPPPNGQQGPAEPGPGTAPVNDKPKATPVYKKWWFWAVVAVSAYVVYSIATENSKATNTRGRELPQGTVGAQPGGLTLMRW